MQVSTGSPFEPPMETWRLHQIVDITFAPGSSGGPIYGAGGRLVGISNGLMVPFHIGIMVPSRAICHLLGQAKQ
jgi:hypothetical protein